MGRGLGQLQRWILDAAIEKHRKHGQNGHRNEWGEPDPDLTYAEVKAQYFEMPLIPHRDSMNGWRFEKSKIGDYRNISATISMAVHRLQRRGLIAIFKAKRHDTPFRIEIYLTNEGETAAALLKARGT